MRFTGSWLRVDLPRRWRSLLVLALLVSITAGTVLTAVAGARRGASAMNRLAEQTLPATAVVRANTERDTDPGWAAIRAMPGVEAATISHDYTGFGVDEIPTDPVQQYIPLDIEAMRTIERPVLLAGRLAEPRRDDEAVVTQQFVDTWKRGVGDVVTVRLFSPEQIDNGISAIHNIPVPRPAGAAIPTTIVGVVRSPRFSDQVGGTGQLIPSPGLYPAHRTDVLGAAPCCAQWGLVRLSDGEAGLGAFRDRVVQLPDWGKAEVISRAPAIAHARDVSRFEAGCLLAFAAVALVVGLVMITAMVSREVAAVAADLRLLLALGLTGGQGTAAAAAGSVLAGSLGALLGLPLSAAGSALMPFGTASTVEPRPGVDIDLMLLPTGALLVALLVAAVACGLAWVSVMRSRDAPSAEPGDRRAVRAGAVRAGAVRAGVGRGRGDASVAGPGLARRPVRIGAGLAGLPCPGALRAGRRHRRGAGRDRGRNVRRRRPRCGRRAAPLRSATPGDHRPRVLQRRFRRPGPSPGGDRAGP